MSGHRKGGSQTDRMKHEGLPCCQASICFFQNFSGMCQNLDTKLAKLDSVLAVGHNETKQGSVNMDIWFVRFKTFWNYRRLWPRSLPTDALHARKQAA